MTIKSRVLGLLLVLFVIVGLSIPLVEGSAEEHGVETKTCSTEADGSVTCSDEAADNPQSNESQSTMTTQEEEEYEEPEVDVTREVQACLDEDENCKMWAESGECTANPAYMLRHCRKACKVCQLEDEKIDFGEEQVAEGEYITETLAVIHKSRDYVENVVWKDDKFISVREECKNRHELCAFWAVLGECEKNPNYMLLNCAPSCQTCEQIDIQIRCPLDPDAPNAMGPGDVNKLFERITTDPEFIETYSPTIYSRPKGPSVPRGDYKFGPWVVTLQNFMSQEECDTLIKLGAGEGYERSMDVGEKKFDGSFGSYESKDRTSENAWCQNDCYNHPISQDVVARIENITGIPETNSENLQLLKYEVGQFYRAHHDYIEHQVDRQSGVRLLTFFLYLNDVEEGGGTRFPQLDITVQPKRGQVLLWPSVYDHDPNLKDPTTEHEALPVKKGVKYAANAWLHMRDFKTPNDNGCG
eukprot:CAMPEP_0118724462 /NCGR_PEP_ID=MMETSP0800-20121206/32590_1 /TAXON_ID=210618 ORGANISM="Striatella unipunctata, Strain CCMP2910" /NCGR_SAMPLE_ID=MMETSP0800 /ASSEMBLY_ACC=CAM_ASM_000638 /LENGTH=470 /DNA_ID=CAMNT_0006633037 /DNA_START=34 /DNA_END=1446 /DNA_ORIENTATION=-